MERGDLVPHFHVTTVEGRTVHYSDIWQRRNLVLITLEDAPADAMFARDIVSHDAEFRSRSSECVVTRDAVSGIPRRGVLIADRWGEIVYVEPAADDTALPSVADLLAWLDYVEMRCPECEGEAR